MRKYAPNIRGAATQLRIEGYSYAEICKELGMFIPKPTMYHWFRGLVMSAEGKKRNLDIVRKSIKKAQDASALIRAVRRKEYFLEKEIRNKPLLKEFSSLSVRKVTLATLYMTEGSRSENAQVMFGNSDPGIISLFLGLLRETYQIDESKFRCTLQARDDQDIPGLEKFWSEITGIPLTQFYKARIDPRSVGKVSYKKEYKGVCRINYFSADLLYELMVVGNLLKGARSSAG